MKYSNLELALMARQLLIAKTERPAIYNQFIIVMHFITKVSPPELEAIITEYAQNE